MLGLRQEKESRLAADSTWRLLHWTATALAIMGAVGFLAKYRLSLEPPRQPPAAWHPAAPSPIARAEGPGVVVNGKLYVVGGFNSRNLDVTNRHYAYDPQADRWQRLADMPVSNTHIVGAVDGDTVWYAGGYVGKHPGKAIRDVYKYHVPSDRWTKGPPLPEPRAAGVLVRLGRNLHYISGLSLDRDTNYGDHWILPLDGVQQWTPRAPMPMPRGHMGAAVLDGKIYVVGGQFHHDNHRRDLAYVHRYDPGPDKWTEMAPLPFAVSHIELSTVVWKGRIYIFGGRSDSKTGRLKRLADPQPSVLRSTALPDVFAYDPASDRWEPQPELPVGLLGPVVGVIGDLVVLTNGSTMNTFFAQSSTYVGCFPLTFRRSTVRGRAC